MVDYNAVVETKWSYNNRMHYENSGYTFTGHKKELLVRVRDLLPQSNVKVPVICDICNEPYTTEFYNVTRNKKQICNDCRGQYLKDLLAYNYEKVKELVESAEFTLLSNKEEYLAMPTTKAYLVVRCPKGHQNETTIHNWLKGRENIVVGYRCKSCNNLDSATIHEIRVELEKEGYKLRTTEYVNSYTKLEALCPNDNLYRKSWNEWKNGDRCYCLLCSGGAVVKHDIYSIKSRLEPHGITVLSKEYKPEGRKAGNLEFLCPLGHKAKNRLDDIFRKLGPNQSKGCSECGKLKKAENLKKLSRISKAALEINFLLGGDCNTLEVAIDGGKYLDMVLKEFEKGFCEYDGGGHFLSNFRNENPLTLEEIVEKDNQKRNKLFQDGWKGIIIVSTDDKLPPEDLFKNILERAKEILKSKKYRFVIVVLDEGVLRYGAETVAKMENGKVVYQGVFTEKIEMGEKKVVSDDRANKLRTMWGLERK